MTTQTLVATPDPPDRRDLTSRQITRLARNRSEAEAEIYSRQLRGDVLIAIDEIDTEVLVQISEFALGQEFRFIDRIRAEAQGDLLKAELGARKLDLLAASNAARARRISRSL